MPWAVVVKWRFHGACPRHANSSAPTAAGAEAAPPRPRRRRHRSWLQGTAASPRVDDEEAFERAVDAQVEEDRVLDIGGYFRA